MTYTADELKQRASWLDAFEDCSLTAKMLRAGSDAMEREKQARNQALEEAATICQTEGDEWDSDSLKTYKNYAHACRDAIRAMKEKTE